MCGRFTIALNPEVWQAMYNIDPPIGYTPNYNAAPTQNLPVIINQNKREALLMRWGLIPFWAKDEKIGYSMINAKAETLAEKPSFRTSFKSKRCLIPADGFYEWKKIDAKTKVPYRIHLKDNKPFAFAGLWDTWNHEGKELDTFTIITTEPNVLMKGIHDRMPVILPQQDYDLWLDKDAPPEVLQQQLKPYEGKDMEVYEVSKNVNSPSINKPELLTPVKI